eukprot:Amastigsp_a179142_5.p3 type:complete len:115 gc:universal Amastigsp_a179142_5:388-732(+)
MRKRVLSSCAGCCACAARDGHRACCGPRPCRDTCFTRGRELPAAELPVHDPAGRPHACAQHGAAAWQVRQTAVCSRAARVAARCSGRGRRPRARRRQLGFDRGRSRRPVDRRLA